MDADYIDNLVFLTNTPVQAKSLLYSLYVNSDKIDFMYSKQDSTTSKLNENTLKLVDHLTYLSSNIFR